MSIDSKRAIAMKILNLHDAIFQAALALVHASRDKQVAIPYQISDEFDALQQVVDEFESHDFEAALYEEQTKDYPPFPPDGYVYATTRVGKTLHLMRKSGGSNSLCMRRGVSIHSPKRHVLVCSKCVDIAQDPAFSSQLDEYYANLPD